jgi:O-antigen ligase
MLVGGSLVAAFTMAAILVATPAGQRLTETFDLDGGQMENMTASARVTVYGKVLSYVSESPARIVAGVGMGPDFLTAADATGDYDPGETLGVRSPHNFLLGTFARLGIVGVVLQLLVVGLGYVLAWQVARTGTQDLLTQLAALLVAAMPVAAAVGVVLESPFGAVPYYWAYGTLVVLQGGAYRGPEPRPVAPSTERIG